MTLGSRGQKTWQACNSIAVIKIFYSDRQRLFPVHLRCCMLHLQQVACPVWVACFAFIFVSFKSWFRSLGLLILNVVCVDYERVVERFAYFALSPTLGILKIRYPTLLNCQYQERNGYTIISIIICFFNIL